MRISDWSSDVCSSDLQRTVIHHAQLTEHIPAADPVIRQTVEALGQATPGGAQGALQRGALMLDHMIAQQAAQIGFNEIFHLLGILFIVVLAFVWFARPPFAAKLGGGVAAGGQDRKSTRLNSR